MDSFSTIIIIAIIIVASVGGMTYVQKAEQAKAKLRQQVAKYRYRANEVAQILENFVNVPIGAEARKLLLQYAQINLSAANRLIPNDASIVRNLTNIKSLLNEPAAAIDNKKLILPRDITQLSVLVKNLSTLGKYLQKFQTIKAMNTAIIPTAINKLNLLIAETKISAYVKQGQAALLQHDYVKAQRNFQTAQQMLNKFPKKNNRLIDLEKELKLLASSTPKQVTEQTQLEKSLSEAEDLPQNDVFGPKKKW